MTKQEKIEALKKRKIIALQERKEQERELAEEKKAHGRERASKREALEESLRNQRNPVMLWGDTEAHKQAIQKKQEKEQERQQRKEQTKKARECHEQINQILMTRLNLINLLRSPLSHHGPLLKLFLQEKWFLDGCPDDTRCVLEAFAEVNFTSWCDANIMHNYGQRAVFLFCLTPSMELEVKQFNNGYRLENESSYMDPLMILITPKYMESVIDEYSTWMSRNSYTSMKSRMNVGYKSEMGAPRSNKFRKQALEASAVGSLILDCLNRDITMTEKGLHTLYLLDDQFYQTQGDVLERSQKALNRIFKPTFEELLMHNDTPLKGVIETSNESLHDRISPLTHDQALEIISLNMVRRTQCLKILKQRKDAAKVLATNNS